MASAQAVPPIEEVKRRIVSLQKALEEEKAGGKPTPTSTVGKLLSLANLDDLIQTLTREEVAAVQDSLVKALTEAIALSPSPPIRRILPNCLCALYTNGSRNLPRENIQFIIGLLNNKSTTYLSKLACLQCLETIYVRKGMEVTSQFPEVVAACAKHIKAPEAQLRVAVVDTLGRAAAALGPMGSFVHAEVHKLLKTTFADKASEVKAASYRCHAALFRAAPPEGVDKLLGQLVKVLEETAEPPLQRAIAECIGAIAAASVKAASTPQAAAVAAAAAKKKKDVVVWTLATAVGFLGGVFRAGPMHRDAATVALLTFLRDLEADGAVEPALPTVCAELLRLLDPQQLKGTPPAEVLLMRARVSQLLHAGLLGPRPRTDRQLAAARLLVGAVKAKGASEHVVFAGLRELAEQVFELGPAAAVLLGGKVELPDQLAALAAHPALRVRFGAALCWRALGTALPHLLAGFVQAALNRTTVDFAELTTPLPGNAPRQPSPALQGSALAAAALFASVSTAPLGIPVEHVNFGLKTGLRILDAMAAPSTAPGALLVMADAGWNLIGALTRVGAAVSEYLERKLSRLVAAWTASLLPSDVPPKSESEVVLFCKVKASALAALYGFLSAPGGAGLAVLAAAGDHVLAHFVGLLSRLATAVATFPDTSGFQPISQECVAQAKLYLYRCFAALPAPASYAALHPTLAAAAAKELVDSGTAATSLLPSMLSADDDLLDSTEAGGDGSLPALPSLAGSTMYFRHESVWLADAFGEATTDPPVATAVGLVDAAVELFAVVFGQLGDSQKQPLLEGFVAAVKSASEAAGEGGASAQRKYAVQANTVAAVLRVVRGHAARRMKLGGEPVVATAQRFLKGSIAAAQPVLSRAAGEALGLLARTEGDRFTEALVKSVVGVIKKNKEPTVRGGCAFVLGCVHRSVGGMSTAAQLPATLHVLLSLGPAPSPQIHLWVLAALAATIDASGSAFSPHAVPTLGAVHALLASEPLDSQAGQRLLGRVVNALVGALGPELTAASAVLQSCAAVHAALRAHPAPAVQLEAIAFRQRLILFAPHAVDIPAVVGSLVSLLDSPHLALRSAVAACLRQLAQHNAAAVDRGADRIERKLFSMLDAETDPTLRRELRLLLASLVDQLAPAQLARWIDLCKAILTASTGRRPGPPQRTGGGASSAGADAETDDGAGMAGPQAGLSGDEEGEEGGSGIGAVGTGSLTDGAGGEEGGSEYAASWQTKVVALESLSRLVAAAGPQPEHYNLRLARQAVAAAGGASRDYLVLHLPDLVTLAFQAATAATDALRPWGLQILRTVIKLFSMADDPDYEGHPLLEQYQAQIAAALRPAFAKDAPPSLAVIAAPLVVDYLHTPGVAADPVVVRRVLGLLTAEVDGLRALSYPLYHEAASRHVRVAVLVALARVLLSLATKEALLAEPTPMGKGRSSVPQSPPVAALLRPHLAFLRAHWLALLRDVAVRLTQPEAVQKGYQPVFLPPAGAVSLSKAAAPSSVHAPSSASTGLSGSSSGLAPSASLDTPLHAQPQQWLTVLAAAASLVGTPVWDEGRDAPEPVVPKEGLSAEQREQAEQNIKLLRLLKESRPEDDFVLMLGLAMYFMTTPAPPADIAGCVEACTNLLRPALCTPATFPPAVCRELLELVMGLPQYRDPKVQLAVARLLDQLAAATSPQYVAEAGEPLLDQMADLATFPIDTVLPAATLSQDAEALLVTSLHCVGLLGPLCCAVGTATMLNLLPSLLYSVISAMKAGNERIISAAVEAIRMLAVPPSGSFASPGLLSEWEGVQLRALASLRDSLEAPANDHFLVGLVSAIFAVVDALPGRRENGYSLHLSCAATLQRILLDTSTQRAKLQQAILQGIRSIVQSASSPAANIYLRELLPTVVVLLVRIGRAKADNVEWQLPIVTDGVKLVLLAQTIAPQPHKQTLLAVVVPTLIELLHPDAPPSATAVHDMALQLLMHLASTIPEFRGIVNSLPPALKQQLEASVRANVEKTRAAQQAAASASAAAQSKQPSSIQMPKLDFSKYS